jgi:hypothetical protein
VTGGARRGEPAVDASILRSRTLSRFALAGAAVLGLLVWACDPDWFLYARNHSAELLYLRLYTLSYTDVYEVPPGFEGHVSSASSFEGRIELLNRQCELLDEARVPQDGAVLATIHRELSVTVESIGIDDIDGPFATEIEGPCEPTSPLP